MVLRLHSELRVPERLLVIDAAEQVRTSYARHFEAAGFAVRTVACFSEAQRLTPASFDAVIADVCQPTADAPDPAIAAALRGTGAAVVVLTAYGEPARAALAARIGVADAFLHKPVSLVWLEMLLRGRIAARRHGRRGAPAPLPA
ncbi:MAG TPA: hypothetical protein VMX54_01080 [Vicinamibacteria bacterium]|nr:hypothetical protein [Vicinamibacteria bacterium]